MMKHSVKLVSLLAIASLSADACAAPAPVDEYYVSGVQVGIGQCLFAPSRGDTDRDRVGAVIAAAAISKGVNLLTNAVTEAAKAKTWTASGSRNFEATSANFPQCVQVARGRFYVNRPVVGDWAGSWGATRKAALLANGLFLADQPDFFFEGEFDASENKEALSIRPVYSSFSNPIGTRWLRRGRDRNIALFFAITPPGTKPSLETAPAATIVLGQQLPPTSKQYGQAGKTYRSPLESSWFTLTKADTRKPLTVHALITETQGADAFLAFIGSVLSDESVKKAMVAEASQILIPSVGAAAAETEAQAAVTAANNADEKLATALGKLEACRTAAPTAMLTAAAQAKIALRNYLIADQALDSDARDGLIDESAIENIDLKNPPGLRQSCDTVYQSLAGTEE